MAIWRDNKPDTLLHYPMAAKAAWERSLRMKGKVEKCFNDLAALALVVQRLTSAHCKLGAA
jgi:hypothetical protein